MKPHRHSSATLNADIGPVTDGDGRGTLVMQRRPGIFNAIPAYDDLCPGIKHAATIELVLCRGKAIDDEFQQVQSPLRRRRPPPRHALSIRAAD